MRRDGALDLDGSPRRRRRAPRRPGRPDGRSQPRAIVAPELLVRDRAAARSCEDRRARRHRPGRWRPSSRTTRPRCAATGPRWSPASARPIRAGTLALDARYGASRGRQRRGRRRPQRPAALGPRGPAHRGRSDLRARRPRRVEDFPLDPGSALRGADARPYRPRSRPSASWSSRRALPAPRRPGALAGGRRRLRARRSRRRRASARARARRAGPEVDLDPRSRGSASTGLRLDRLGREDPRQSYRRVAADALEVARGCSTASMVPMR